MSGARKPSMANATSGDRRKSMAAQNQILDQVPAFLAGTMPTIRAWYARPTHGRSYHGTRTNTVSAMAGARRGGLRRRRVETPVPVCHIERAPVCRVDGKIHSENVDTIERLPPQVHAIPCRGRRWHNYARKV